jgi:hypothetical protein
MTKTTRWMAAAALALAAGLGLGCSDHEDHGDETATCDELASLAAAECGATFVQPMCVTDCEAAGHPATHLGGAKTCIEAAADCDAVLQCLATDSIC